MSRSRLAALLGPDAPDEGLSLPDGPVVALRPPADADLGVLGRDRVTVVHGFRPDRDAWADAGYAIADELGPQLGAAVVALAFVPRSKALARALVAEAASLASLVLVDGQRAAGVDSLWREVRARRPRAGGIAQAHGRLFWFAGGAGFEDWAMPAPVQGEGGLWTQPGVFSERGLDRGSALLAAALPARLPPRMADFGAGVGALARAALTREGVVALDLVEAESLALDCARRNVLDPRARFLWADALTLPAGTEWDGIVMNPPFHAGAGASDPALGRSFVAAAARHLASQGQLWLVANRRLPYEAALAEAFRDVSAIGGDGGYKLVHAAAPRSRDPRRSARRPVPRGVAPRGAARRHPAG